MALREAIQAYLTEHYGPEGLKNAFYLGQVALGGAFAAALWLLRPGRSESGFAVRESDRVGSKARSAGGPELAAARIEKKAPPALPGIRIDGSPYQILGVSPVASADEIKAAYRELMKRYHPDKVGRPGTREWQDAQKIAEALTRARDELLKKSR